MTGRRKGLLCLKMKRTLNEDEPNAAGVPETNETIVVAAQTMESGFDIQFSSDPSDREEKGTFNFDVQLAVNSESNRSG